MIIHAGPFLHGSASHNSCRAPGSLHGLPRRAVRRGPGRPRRLRGGGGCATLATRAAGGKVRPARGLGAVRGPRQAGTALGAGRLREGPGTGAPRRPKRPRAGPRRRAARASLATRPAPAGGRG